MMAPTLPLELDIEASKIYARRQLSPRRRSLDRPDMPEAAADRAISDAMASYFQRHLDAEARKLSAISGIMSPAAAVSQYRETSWFTEEFEREFEAPQLDTVQVGPTFSACILAAPGGLSKSTLVSHGSATTTDARMSVASTRTRTSDSSASSKSAVAADSATTASFEHRSTRWLDPLPARQTSPHSCAEHVGPATSTTEPLKSAKSRTRTRDSTKSPPPKAKEKMPPKPESQQKRKQKQSKRAKLKRRAWVIVMMATFRCRSS